MPRSNSASDAIDADVARILRQVAPSARDGFLRALEELRGALSVKELAGIVRRGEDFTVLLDEVPKGDEQLARQDRNQPGRPDAMRFAPAERREQHFADDPRAVGKWKVEFDHARLVRLQCDARIPPSIDPL